MTSSDPIITTCPHMVEAWSGFVDYAARSADAQRAFAKAHPEKADRDDTVVLLAKWATLTQWGVEGVPQSFMNEACAEFPNEAKALVASLAEPEAMDL